MGHLWFNGCGIYGWGNNGKLLFRLEIFSKNAGLQGSTLSNHHMTTGFSPFELPTCGLLLAKTRMPETFVLLCRFMMTGV